MTILNHLFGSAESLAKNAKKADESIFQAWMIYRNTILYKRQTISHLPYSFGHRKALLRGLQQALDLELVNVQAQESKEQDIISDLRSLEHSERIRRVHRLEESLAYAETKYKCVYNLLLHLYVTLRSEADLCKKLTKAELRPFRKHVARLQLEFKVEEGIIKKIDAIETFPQLLQDLVKGEHIIQELTAREKRIVKMMQRGSPKEGLIDQWVMGVFDAIEDAVYEFIAAGTLDQHSHADLEFVNRPEFIALAAKIIRELQGKDVHSEMLNAFVHLFREKYNTERA